MRGTERDVRPVLYRIPNRNRLRAVLTKLRLGMNRRDRTGSELMVSLLKVTPLAVLLWSTTSWCGAAQAARKRTACPLLAGERLA